MTVLQIPVIFFRTTQAATCGMALVTACIVTIVCCSDVSARPDRPSNPDGPPNIVFILIDDMGWKDIGCAGSTFYDTPHIDKLASEGVRFLNAYSAAPVCTQSNPAVLNRLTQRLDSLLKEMGAEMPRKNPDFKPAKKSRRQNLKSTRDLAERERQLFESRLAK